MADQIGVVRGALMLKQSGGFLSSDVPARDEKPSSAPASTSRGYKKFSFTGN